MFCENCGAKIEDGQLFCQNCGKKIEPPVAQGAQQTTAPAAEQTVRQPAANENDFSNQFQTQTAVTENPMNTVPSPVNNPYARPQQIPAQQNPQQFGYTPAPKKPPFKLNKKIVIIASSIAAVVVIGVVILCVAISNANNPVKKMTDAINAGDYDAAERIFYSDPGAFSGNTDIKELINTKADEVKNAYVNGTFDYDTALDKINELDEIPLSSSTYINDVKDFINDLNSSNGYFKEAESCLNNKDYSGAIYYYDMVIKEDKNYDTAQSQRAKAVDGIRQNYLDNAKKSFDEGEYYYAFSYLFTGLENDYLKDDEKLNKQIDTYIDEIIKVSDNLFNEKKYGDAVYAIENVQSYFENDSSRNDKLNAQIKKINTETPALLYEIDYHDSSYFYRYQSGSKDVVGNTYDSDNVCTLETSKYSSDGEFFVEVYAKDYKKIMGTFAVENGTDAAAKGHIEILGDDKVIYKSETFTSKSKPVNFEVNITGCEWIKIRAVPENKKADLSIILADVELYKIGSSAPDAPAASEPASKPESSKAESSKESSKAESSKKAS